MSERYPDGLEAFIRSQDWSCDPPTEAAFREFLEEALKCNQPIDPGAVIYTERWLREAERMLADHPDAPKTRLTGLKDPHQG